MRYSHARKHGHSTHTHGEKKKITLRGKKKTMITLSRMNADRSKNNLTLARLGDEKKKKELSFTHTHTHTHTHTLEIINQIYDAWEENTDE